MCHNGVAMGSHLFEVAFEFINYILDLDQLQKSVYSIEGMCVF